MRKRLWERDGLALWLMAIPAMVHILIFKYVPLAGNVIAFQNFSIFKGFAASPWVGWFHFERMFTYAEFYDIMRNTLLISFYSIAFGFPAPLIAALLINEVRLRWYKRSVQTMLYMPHFLSWVIVGGLFLQIFGLEGVANAVAGQFGFEPRDYMTEPAYFRGIVVISGIWKEVGWGMIIFLAALAGVNPNMYEAAMIDGAGRFRRMWSISLPAIMPAIIVLFLLRIGTLLDLNVEQLLIMLSPLTRGVGEVIDTYVYRVGLIGSQYSFTTAIGLFKSAIGLALIVSLNYLSKKTTGDGIY